MINESEQRKIEKLILTYFEKYGKEIKVTYHYKLDVNTKQIQKGYNVHFPDSKPNWVINMDYGQLIKLLEKQVK